MSFTNQIIVTITHNSQIYTCFRIFEQTLIINIIAAKWEIYIAYCSHPELLNCLYRYLNNAKCVLRILYC